jgi:hypothetical protein
VAELAILYAMQSLHETFWNGTPAPEQTTVPDEGECVLNVLIAYQDLAAKEWAMDTWGRVMQLVGNEKIHADTWMIRDLMRPGIFTESIRAAAHADVVVMAVSGMEEIAFDLQVWFDAWLPYRASSACALVALIGHPAPTSPYAANAMDYFREVAQKGGLVFFPRSCELPADSTQIRARNHQPAASNLAS